MRVLVTGATGFVGRYVARAFAARGADVHALARPPADRLDLSGVTAVEGDLGDADSLAPLTALAPDVICHVAADTRMDATADELEVNVQGTANLVAALRETLPGKRFLFASSIAAVDRAGRPRGPLTVEDPPKPRSPYAMSKLRCEELLAAEAEARGFSLTSLRLGTVYGPGTDKGGVVSLARAVRNGALSARLPWPGRISFVFVEDVAEVFARLAESPEPVPGTFFVSEGRGHSMSQAAAVLRGVQAAEKGPFPFPAFLLRMAGWTLYLPGLRSVAPWSLRCALADTILCDSDPIAKRLDLTWTPLEEGLRRTFG